MSAGAVSFTFYMDSFGRSLYPKQLTSEAEYNAITFPLSAVNVTPVAFGQKHRHCTDTQRKWGCGRCSPGGVNAQFRLQPLAWHESSHRL